MFGYDLSVTLPNLPEMDISEVLRDWIRIPAEVFDQRRGVVAELLFGNMATIDAITRLQLYIRGILEQGIGLAYIQIMISSTDRPHFCEELMVVQFECVSKIWKPQSD